MSVQTSLLELKFSDGAYFAQSSIKPVRITEFDDGEVELFMLKGSFEDPPLTHKFFDCIDKAIRYAECYVGMHIQMGDA